MKNNNLDSSTQGEGFGNALKNIAKKITINTVSEELEQLGINVRNKGGEFKKTCRYIIRIKTA